MTLAREFGGSTSAIGGTGSTVGARTGAVADYRPWPTGAGPNVPPNRPQPVGPQRGAERIAAIDAARGLAIVLVLLSHFAMRFATEAGRPSELGWPVMVGMIASPTFVLLSGVVYGTLSSSPSFNGRRLQNLLFDRGLFLIVVAHPLLAASNLLRGTPGAWHHLYITDTIAPALLLGPALASRTRPRTRVLLGCILVLASWIVLALPTPGETTLGLIVREALVGTLQHGGESWWGFHWPLAPWFGVYLIGTAIGESLTARHSSPWRGSRSQWLFWSGCLAASVGMTVNLLFALAAQMGMTSRAAVPALFHLTSVTSKFPPSPAYLLWFGGLGLALMSVMYVQLPARWHVVLLRLTQRMGRSSLVLYVAGDYLFHVPFLVWHPHGLGWWFPMFVAVLLPLYWLANFWTGIGGNRFLTVGYPHGPGVL